MPQVLFIGAGRIGTALAHVINNRADINLWDQDSTRVLHLKPLAESVPLANVIFLCVPSWVISDVLGQILPFLHPTTIIISLAKGIEASTLSTMDAVIANILPVIQPWGILGGPLLAEELMNELPGIGVLASTSHLVYREVAKLFLGSTIRLEYVNDPYTVALAAVLKNVYAISLGVADGLGWGWNGQGWLAAQALTEMTSITETLAGDSSIISSSAGAGDFLATAMSPNSRNRTAGREIALTGLCQIPSEGCRSISSLIALLNHTIDQFPILSALNQIINQHDKAVTVFNHLFRQQKLSHN